MSTSPQIPQKILASLGLILSLLIGPHLSSRAQTLDSNPAFDIGDKWTYRFHDKGNRKEPYLITNQAFKSEGSSGWIYAESQDPSTRRKQSILRYDYKRADNKERFAFNPKNPLEPGPRFSNSQLNDDNIQLPLAVGKKYKVILNWSNGEGNTKYDAEVEAFEKIKVGAGEFDAYRIKLSGWWTRTVGEIFSGRASHTIYFAPSVKRFVKWDYFERNNSGVLTSDETNELVNWEPNAPLDPALRVTAPAAAASAPQ